jgi:hypothetical protein
MQHTQHHYVYIHMGLLLMQTRARVCVCMPRGMPTAAAKALCRRLRIQLLPRSFAWTTDAISPSPVCNVRFLVALAADSINYYTSHGERKPNMLIYFLLKHSRRRGRCVICTGTQKAPASDSILLIEFGCVCSSSSSRMPPSGNGRGRVGALIGAHMHTPLGPRRVRAGLIPQRDYNR